MSLWMDTDVSQRFCSIPSTPWPPRRTSPSVQTSAQAWPVGDNPTTDIPGLHPPCRPILQVSIASIIHYPWAPLFQCTSGETGVDNPCVANNDEHWERMHPHLAALPALIWGRRIWRKQGRAKGDIWLLEPLAPISTYQVKILASS